ncbi:MAG: glucose-6-phosphate isomerase, partial [Pirellulales bacterium]
FFDLPERLLEEFEQRGVDSEVGRVLATARRIGEMADRVVLLGIGGSYMGARALMEACCHPYHNGLTRQARGGRPRLYFEGNNVDNDASQGLLDLLGRDQQATGTDDRWGLVVISKSGGTLETAVAFRQFLAALDRSCDGDARRLAELVVPVTGPSGRLAKMADGIGCHDRFTIPDGVGGRFSVLTAVGLLPAALLGIDVVALLTGAAVMNRHFRDADVGHNVVLDYTGICHLMEAKRGASIRVLATWGKNLEATGLWYDQLLAESLGKQQQGALPLTVVNTRDLHSRGQQHQQGRRDKLITNLIVDSPRRDTLAVGHRESDFDKLNAFSEKSLPDIMAAAIAGTNRAYAEDGRPTANLHLPRVDEERLGQLLQMFMLATVVEGRLIGINPYGQPGVEAYKKHMNAFLRE